VFRGFGDRSRKRLSPGFAVAQSGFKNPRDAAQNLRVDLLPFEAGGPGADISPERPTESAEEARPVDGYR
jgi:hypothetical protein